MSKANAEMFLDQLENNADFRSRFIGAGSVQERNRLLVESGMQFDKKDMHEAMAQRHALSLTEAQLTSITGGAHNINKADLENIAFMHVYGVTASV